MINQAQDLGADTVIKRRFMMSAFMGETAELLAYGTAVKIRKL
jgi:uncharacterized protein YbjQ (UPF0145 family)